MIRLKGNIKASYTPINNTVCSGQSVTSLHSAPKPEQYMPNISAYVIHNKSQTFYRADVRGLCLLLKNVRGLCSSSLVSSSSKCVGRFSYHVIKHFWAVPPCKHFHLLDKRLLSVATDHADHLVPPLTAKLPRSE